MKVVLMRGTRDGDILDVPEDYAICPYFQVPVPFEPDAFPIDQHSYIIGINHLIIASYRVTTEIFEDCRVAELVNER
jgi:hypothetical protein